ncbi:hypothetical protein ACPCSC_30195 [Streptomyces lavendulocolor]|uniref:hypothetical protein n=1 Tax=Streptomyces lavendulocolor TaxID=67316 RepID=UPI003C2C6980
MTVLPVTALPYIPSAFSAGDRLTLAGDSQIRDDQGRWTCVRPECGHVSTDAHVRDLYTDTESLTMWGLPLIAPAPVNADEPLPGRPVAVGEPPFEADRPYLMAGDLLHVFGPVTELEPGPWGIAQGASTFSGPRRPGPFEMSLTATGVVWARKPSRFGGGIVTTALIPAELPTGDDLVTLMSLAVMRAALPEGAFAVRLV